MFCWKEGQTILRIIWEKKSNLYIVLCIERAWYIIPSCALFVLIILNPWTSNAHITRISCLTTCLPQKALKPLLIQCSSTFTCVYIHQTAQKKSSFRRSSFWGTHTQRGSYSRKGMVLPSKCLFKSPFVEPLLRILLGTLPPSKTYCKTPSKSPS